MKIRNLHLRIQFTACIVESISGYALTQSQENAEKVA